MEANTLNKSIKLIVIFTIAFLLTSCSRIKPADNPLDPEKPITVTLWHYYNGKIKESFDNMVYEFNETVGIEQGIVIEPQSHGEVGNLEAAIFDSANGAIGSLPMPDIFSVYADNAYRISELVNLVSLDKYFTEEELYAYRTEFLDEGKFLKDKKPYILPVAKASENLFVNKTDWEPFANEYGFTNEDLATWEGIYRVSKKYYEEKGRSFFSIDSNANFMILFSKQLGSEILSQDENGKEQLDFPKPLAKEIWNYFYVPYINGYYSKTGRFSSDDAKTGAIIAFISSTSGAGYFPKEVTNEKQKIYKIEPLILPFPYYDKDNLYVIQQGAGMCMVESDEAHEYASAVFLKWLTETDKNIEFAINTGYLPVTNQAYEDNLLLSKLKEEDIPNPAIIESLKVTTQMFKNYSLYTNNPSQNSFEIRNLFGKHLFDKITNDLELVELRVENGENKELVIYEMISDQKFNEWFDSIIEEAESVLQ